MTSRSGGTIREMKNKDGVWGIVKFQFRHLEVFTEPTESFLGSQSLQGAKFLDGQNWKVPKFYKPKVLENPKI